MNARNFFTELKRPGKRLQVRGFLCLAGKPRLFEVSCVLGVSITLPAFIVNANYSVM